MKEILSDKGDGMRITPEILRGLEFDEHDGVWKLHQFELRKDPKMQYVWCFRAADGYEHSVDHVSELIYFAFQEGYEIGKHEARREIRKVLGIRDKGD